MHPAYTSDKPGIAPDCGMRLEPVYADPTPPIAGEHTGHEGGATKLPMGTIKISPEKQQLIGVRFGEAQITEGARTIRALGKVTIDETRIVRVHPRIEGWIDQVFVDFVGKEVAKGQKLLTVYSPEMFATQQEFLLALRSNEIMRSSTLHSAMQHSNSMIEATRRRLELFDLSESQIEEIARTKEPIRNIALFSPISGYVVSKNSFPKQRITPDMELYAIADLSSVWVVADVFESEADSVQLGMGAVVTISKGGRLPARVTYIQPQVDPATRTLKVRLDIPNPGMRLKPDMFADVDLSMPTARRLTVPSEAVLDTGLRQTVFVDHGNGYLEPRLVETGERESDRIEIRKGLRAGERIVTSAAFLIDSESQMQSAASGMTGHQHGGAALSGGDKHD
jgi:RND family efflux transporter MFP subunit